MVYLITTASAFGAGIVDRGSGIGEGIVGTLPAVSACGVVGWRVKSNCRGRCELLLRQLGGVSLSVIVPMGYCRCTCELSHNLLALGSAIGVGGDLMEFSFSLLSDNLEGQE